VDRFKALKKDARTIAAQQVQRLEIAMCARRRWSEEVFRQFLAGHALLRHLVQRLVWGVYAMDSAEESRGGRLVCCLRVAEDGSFADAQDSPLQLPGLEHLAFGLPHALEISALDATAFSQLFADYELLQPFAQLGRETFALAPGEGERAVLARWKGRVVPTHRVLGLINRGWRRGDAQDGGAILDFHKNVNPQQALELGLVPGVIVGLINEYAEQTLQDVSLGTAMGGIGGKGAALGDIDPIATSELIRDMEYLCNG